MADYWVVHALMALVTVLLLISKSCAASTPSGEQARWLVSSSRWATLSWIEGGDDLQSLALSIASSDEGRIFLYLMENITFKASLTFSEAQIDPTQFFGAACGPEGSLDPQDPRCAKLTISGVVSPVEDESEKKLALDTLFAAHPQMADWPEDHGFIPCEMTIHETNGLWMIANFGGGGYMPASQFYESSPVRHANEGFDGGDSDDRRRLEGGGACYDPHTHACECLDEKCGDANCQAAGGIWTEECGGDGCDCDASTSNLANGTVTSSNKDERGDEHGHDNNDGADDPLPLLPRPNFEGDHAGHARWIVSKSLWTTLSTISSNEKEQPFGNIRSIVDGMCLMGSSGLPVFYLPAPDPSTADIKSNEKIALSFTEAVLAERIGSDGQPCGGRDAEDPTCAKLTLIGHARPLEDKGQLELAKRAFGARHPRASWLAEGGSHTGGGYFTMHLKSIMFLSDFGGFTHLTPDDYLNWKPKSSQLPGELSCEGAHQSHNEPQQQLATSSSLSFSALVLVTVASCIGSLLGNMFKDRMKQLGCIMGQKDSGYSPASGVENSLELRPTVV